MTEIYEFDPVIYPTRLWVCKKPKLDDVRRLFYPFDNNGELVENWGDVFDRPCVYANALIVGNKDSRMRGCLISLFKPGQSGAGVCAHEAVHFVAYICDQMGIPLGDFNTSEPGAYLIQWAVNCIWSVLVNDPGKMNGKLLAYYDSSE